MKKLGRDQVIVFSSEVFGTTVAAIVLWIGYRVGGPDTAQLTDAGARLAWGIRWLPFPALTMFAGLALVMRQRIDSVAIDPLRGKDDQLPKLKLYKQYLQNTLEQLVLYVIVHLAFCVVIEPRFLKLEPWFAGLFVVGRGLFLLGYTIRPVWRAPGFGLTYYPTLLLGLFVAYRAVF